MANSVDPDQTASAGAVWSGSALFADAICQTLWCMKFKDIYRTDRLGFGTYHVYPVWTDRPELYRPRNSVASA